MRDFLKNWKTTLAALLGIILVALSFFGYITPTEESGLNEAFKQVFENLEGLIAAILAIILIIKNKKK